MKPLTRETVLGWAVNGRAAPEVKTQVLALLDRAEKAESERDALAGQVAALGNALEIAWGLIANAGEGFWERESVDWRAAAMRWRDEQWNPIAASVINAAREHDARVHDEALEEAAVVLESDNLNGSAADIRALKKGGTK